MTELAFKTGEFTFKHYMTWPEQESWQLFNGVARAMALPNWAHQSVVSEIVRATGELSLRALDGLTLDLNFIDALRLNVE